MEDADKLAKATRTVNARLGLYVHMIVYAAVNALLVAINFIASPGYHWFWWPLFGWGLGLVFHALGIYAYLRGGAIKKRMIEREIAK